MKKITEFLDTDRTIAILLWLAIVYTSIVIWSVWPLWFTVLPIIMTLWLLLQFRRPLRIERIRGKTQ